MSLLKLAAALILLFAAFITVTVFIWQAKQENEELENRACMQQVYIDSLKAENKLQRSHLAYLLKYFDSSKNKLPEPEGIKFIFDSINPK